MLATSENSYSDEAIQSAETFRLLMDAMAHPGKTVEVPEYITGVSLLNAGAAAVGLTLCDHETPVWLDEHLAVEEVTDFLQFRTGCPVTADKSNAMFAFFRSVPSSSDLNDFSIGTPSYPDRSATLVIQVEAVSSDGPITLTGPGIRTSQRLGVNGPGSGFWHWWNDNIKKFPLGMDVIFAAADGIAALPRTVRALETA